MNLTFEEINKIKKDFDYPVLPQKEKKEKNIDLKNNTQKFELFFGKRSLKNGKTL